MAAEIMYLHDLEAEAILPSLVASIVGYSVFGSVYGWTPVFGHMDFLTFDAPIQLVYYALLGVVCGVVGIIYARTFYGVEHIFKQIPLPKWSKPAIGGLAVGLMGLVLPQALGMGYGWVQIGMSNDAFGLPLWVILILPFAKIVATSLSIGSGGSGGIFGPGMVIGGMLGAAFWHLLAPVLPGMPTGAAPFVIIAMMAMFGGIAHAPVAVMLMVAEMTGNLTLLGPAMVAVAIATLVVGDNTIYKSQLAARPDSPAHRSLFAVPLLRRIRASEALTPLTTTVRSDASLAEVEEALNHDELRASAVVDDNGALVGEIFTDDIANMPHEALAEKQVATVMVSFPSVVYESDPLDKALELLGERRVPWLLVVNNERSRHPIGIISTASIAETYASSLNQESNWIAQLAREAKMLEQDVEVGSPLDGQTLSEAKLPAGALVVALRRNGKLIIPNGTTHLKAGDQILALIHRPLAKQVRALIAQQ
jgi:CIC family chloride channel protein